MACELSQLHDDFGSAIMMECNAMSLVQYNYIINTNCIIGRLHFHLNRCYSHHRVSMMPLTVIIITIIIGHVSNGQRQTDKGINKSIEIGWDGVKRWRRNIYLNRSKRVWLIFQTRLQSILRLQGIHNVLKFTIRVGGSLAFASIHVTLCRKSL